jgi:hypothetical protein
MHEKLQTEDAKRITKKRGSTMEPFWGTMLNFLNFKLVNTQGIKGANKHLMMSALTYNPKKLLKFNHKKMVSVYQSLSNSKGRLFSYLNGLLEALIINFRIANFRTNFFTSKSEILLNRLLTRCFSIEKTKIFTLNDFVK